MTSKIRRQWRTPMTLVAALGLSFGATTCYAQEKSEDLKALQKERRELLSKVATGTQELYFKSPGKDFVYPTFQDVFEAEHDSFKADLEYSDMPEQRISALERHKKAADRLLQRAEELLDTARGTSLTVFQIKAYAIEVQIELVKEKRKQRK
jgi:hypothetical protein